MKKIFAVLLITTLFASCSSDDDNNNSENVSATFNFGHNWDGNKVTQDEFNSLQFDNAHGETMSIEKLRYLISNFRFNSTDGQIIEAEGYVLVDVTNNTGLSFTLNTEIPKGSYSNVSFTFGFNAEDNIDGAYPDLNSASWNVPNTPILGSIGGYHYMQLEGRFLDDTDTEVGYAYHTIRAADGSTTPPTIQETSIDVNIRNVAITDDVIFNIEMNIAEWFKNPNTWDLNVLNNMLMPNFDAQIMMNENGQNVFTLGDIIQ